MKKTVLTVAAMMLLTLAAAPVHADIAYDVDFRPDASLTELGLATPGAVDVYNIAGTGDDRPPLNAPTWPSHLQNGIYSGALIEESQLEISYIGVDKGDPLPYSYIALGSVLNWSSQIVMNGATKSTLRLPLVGEDRYDFVALRIYEIDTPGDVVLSVQAVQNGTVPEVDGGGAAMVYENYLGWDWWESGGVWGSSYYYFPDELHAWPWRWDPDPSVTPYTPPPSYWIEDYGRYWQTFDSGFSWIGGRPYVDLNLLIRPDQLYYFSVVAILSDEKKPLIAFTEENIIGVGLNTTLIQGLLDEDEEKWEQRDNLSLDAGWSMIIEEGHGSGMWGVEVPDEWNQTIRFRVSLPPADGITNNFSLMLPVLNNLEEFHYIIRIEAFNASGYRVKWHKHNDTGVLTNYVIGGIGGSYSYLLGNDFILYSAEINSFGLLYPCVPGAGATDYVVHLTLNPFLNGVGEKTKHRLLVYDGNDPFLIATTYAGPTLDDTTPQGPASYHAYNLSFSARYTEGAWQQITGTGLPVIPQPVNVTQPVQAQLGGFDFCLDAAGAPIACDDFWRLAGSHISAFNWFDPTTYDHLATSIFYGLQAVIAGYYEASEAIHGTIQSGFSAVAEHVAAVGEWTYVHLASILTAIYNAMRYIWDHLSEIISIYAIFLGGIIFIFGQSLIFTLGSWIKVQMKRGLFT